MADGVPAAGWPRTGASPPQYQLAETQAPDYPSRTEGRNVLDSDATLILFAAGSSAARSSRCGWPNSTPSRPRWNRRSRRRGRSGGGPAMVGRTGYEALNVAGPRNSLSPGIAALARAFLLGVFGGSKRDWGGRVGQGRANFWWGCANRSTVTRRLKLASELPRPKPHQNIGLLDPPYTSSTRSVGWVKVAQFWWGCANRSTVIRPLQVSKASCRDRSPTRTSVCLTHPTPITLHGAHCSRLAEKRRQARMVRWMVRLIMRRSPTRTLSRRSLSRRGRDPNGSGGRFGRSRNAAPWCCPCCSSRPRA